MVRLLRVIHIFEQITAQETGVTSQGSRYYGEGGFAGAVVADLEEGGDGLFACIGVLHVFADIDVA